MPIPICLALLANISTIRLWWLNMSATCLREVYALYRGRRRLVTVVTHLYMYPRVPKISSSPHRGDSAVYDRQHSYHLS
ncbi:hypothetical protein F4677DRAFT_19239 [Hypoxylon crocopeplum]|nr:hypothetical protein F4677DRAFT_19239 [Hypoxylon crocopeplum]